MKKIQINEKQRAYLLKEDFPSQWNWGTFRDLTSFKNRNEYCREHLTPLNKRGSSRIAFKVDNETVLKLAYNEKGLAQNEAEANFYIHNEHGHILTHIKTDFQDYKDRWIVAEFAHSVNAAQFEKFTGFSFENWCKYVKAFRYSMHPNKYRRFKAEYEVIDHDILKEMHESDFIMDFTSFCNDYGYLDGIQDFCVLTAFGYVVRDGQQQLVIRDYGLTDDVYNRFYNKLGK